MLERYTYGIELSRFQPKNMIPKRILHTPVKNITFIFHLPFLLKAPSPIANPVSTPLFSVTITFKTAKREVKFQDGYVFRERYTMVISSLDWLAEMTLHELLGEPLITKTRFPIEVLNSLIEAYQLLQRDYGTHGVNVIDLGYISGIIRLKGVKEALTFRLRHGRPKDRFHPENVPPRRLLEVAVGLRSNDPVWLARKFYNDIGRHIILEDYHTSVIDCAIVIEMLADLTAREIALKQSSKEEANRILSSGLRNTLNYIYANLSEKNRQEAQSISKWLSEVYRLRNLVAHEGYVGLSEQKAVACRQSTGELADILENLLRTLKPVNSSHSLP